MKRILILDDDRDVLDILETALDYEGYDIKIVETTTDIFSLIDGYRPDLLLIDFSLKGENGGELCRQLKNDERTCQLPVIMISAYPKAFLSPDIYGCDDFIAKPFDLYNLFDRIKTLIEGQVTE